jgi:sigma-B regulation protein RsbU (phosphoserine phosphatase)
MLDEIPAVSTSTVAVKNFTKLVCYTDGLSELKDEKGHDIGTEVIIRHISNKKPLKENIRAMIKELGIPDNNPGLFDDISIIAAELY